LIIKPVPFRSVVARFCTAALLLCLFRPAIAGQQTILVVGDSISAAYGMSLEQGWVALMAEELASSHPEYQVVNASISGDTSGGGLQRLPQLLADYQPVVVVIELGGNDGLRGYPLKTLRSNLIAMGNMSNNANAEVIFIAMEIPPNYGSRYTAGFRESFQLAASNTNSVLASFIMEDIATDVAMVQADGIHPTIAAQPVLVNSFLPTLLEILP